MALLDYERELVIMTNAARHSMSAILTQKDDEQRGRAVEYASKFAHSTG